jgi:Holliday junction resolvase RusA-like endonuclease
MSIQVLKLTLDLPASVNHIYGRNKFGSTYLKKEGKDYKNKMIKYIREQTEIQKWVKVENRFVFLDEVVYFNKKGRDSDNTKKLSQDCITESRVVWIDDTYCLPRTQRVLIDSENPRLEIVLSVAEYIGIFDNENCFNEFLNTYCKSCKRYANNCSILNKALEGRVQKDIEGFKCLKFNKIKNRQ